jgi:hypothetical protein
MPHFLIPTSGQLSGPLSHELRWTWLSKESPNIHFFLRQSSIAGENVQSCDIGDSNPNIKIFFFNAGDRRRIKHHRPYIPLRDAYYFVLFFYIEMSQMHSDHETKKILDHSAQLIERSFTVQLEPFDTDV